MGEIIVFPIWRVRGARWSGKDVDALLAILERISRTTACSSQLGLPAGLDSAGACPVRPESTSGHQKRP